MPAKAADESPEIQELRAQLEEAQETLNAIRRGEVDGLVVSTPKGEQVYSISGAETPYRILVEQMREGAATLSENNTILYCNTGFAKMLKYPMEKIVGMNIESFVCPSDLKAFKSLMAECKGTLKKNSLTRGITLKSCDGLLVPTQLSMNTLDIDHFSTTFIVVTDLTEHMEKEVKLYTTNLEKTGLALFESEQRWATTLGSIGDAVIATDMNAKVTYMNKVAQNLTGWPLHEASGKRVQEIFKIISEETRKVVDDPVSKVIAKGIVVGLANHTILIRKDGTEAAIDDSGAPIKDKNGKITGVILIFRDITERRKTEADLLKTKKLLEETEKSGSIGGWEFDVNTLNQTWTDEIFRILEIDTSHGPPKVPQGLEFINPEYRAKANEAIKRAVEYGEPYDQEWEITTMKGNKRWVHAMARVNWGNGKIVSVSGSFQDITERKNAETALKENEQLYHTVFDNSQDGFQLIELVYDKNGKPIDHKFLKINKAYEKIIGVKAEDILDKSAKYISPNQEPHWLEVPDRVVKTGISEHVELYNKDIDKWLDCFYFLYSKNVVGTLFRDITARKKMEKQLQDSERLAAIGATAGMVGHDIRNPLQAISSDVYLLKSDLDSMPEGEEKENASESLQGIEQNVDYINKIVQDLQDYARPLNPKVEESDLKTIVETLISKNHFPENVKVRLKIADEANKVRADSYYLNRILYNLVTNAVQAMPNGGKLTIEAHKEKDDIVLAVKDTGVGIPKEIRDKMFTLMFTTKSKGQGFGLPVVKRMTESLGGTVTFESEEGKGTTFIVSLPNHRKN